MKKILAEQLILGQLGTNTNFAGNLANAIATDAKGDNLLVYLTIGIPEDVSIKDGSVIERLLFRKNPSLVSVVVQNIKEIDIPDNTVSISYKGSVIRYFKDEESAKNKDGYRYNGNSSKTEEFPYEKIISFEESVKFDIDELEEFNAITVVRHH